MNTDNSLLSLILTLCLIPGYLGNEVYTYWSDLDLQKRLAESDKIGQLSVTYFVNNTDQYDQLFNKLAESCQNTLFIKIDKYIDDDTGQLFNVTDDFLQPLIFMRRYGFNKDSIISTDENVLKSKIEEFEKITEDQFIDIDTLQDDGSPRSNMEDSGNEVVQYRSEKDLEAKLDEFNEELSIIYLVNNTEEYDFIFKNLANSHPTTLFIKINTCDYNGIGMFAISGDFEQPLIYLRRFGVVKDPFSCTFPRVLDTIIQKFQGMTKTDFLQNILLHTLRYMNHEVEDEDMGENSLEINQNERSSIKKEEYFATEVHIFKSEDDLETNLGEFEKLCVIYFVKANDEYDSMFNTLATFFPNTMFLKIDTSIQYGLKRFAIKGSFPEPLILLHRFYTWKNQFSMSNQQELQRIIKEHSDFTEKEFLQNSSLDTTDMNEEDEDEELGKKEEKSLKTLEIIQDEESSRNKEGDSFDRVKYVSTEEELNRTVGELDRTLQMAVIYFVYDTVKFDTLFIKLANKFKTVSFFKVDSKTFLCTKIIIPTFILQPLTVIHKFGTEIKGFCSMDETYFEKEITKYDTMNKNDFLQSIMDSSIDETIKHPTNEAETTALGSYSDDDD